MLRLTLDTRYLIRRPHLPCVGDVSQLVPDESKIKTRAHPFTNETLKWTMSSQVQAYNGEGHFPLPPGASLLLGGLPTDADRDSGELFKERYQLYRSEENKKIMRDWFPFDTFSRYDTIRELRPYFDKCKLIVITGAPACGKSIGVMPHITDFFQRKRRRQYDELGYEQYKKLLVKPVIDDCEKILLLYPNTVTAENVFRRLEYQEREVLKGWRFRLNFDGQCECTYPHLNVDTNAGQPNGYSDRLESKATFNERTRVTDNDNFDGLIMTYQESSQIIDNGRFGFIVIDKAYYPDTISFDTALRSALSAVKKRRCGRVVVMSSSYPPDFASRIKENFDFVFPNDEGAMGTYAVNDQDRKMKIGANIPISPICLYDQFNANLFQHHINFLPIARCRFCDNDELDAMLQSIFNRNLSNNWDFAKAMRTAAEVFDLEHVHFEDPNSLQWNTVKTAAVTAQAMKNIINQFAWREYPCSKPRNRLTTNEKLSQFVPDVIVIARSPDQVNEIVLHLNTANVVYTPRSLHRDPSQMRRYQDHPFRYQRPANQSKFELAIVKRDRGRDVMVSESPFRIMKIVQPHIAEPRQLRLCGKQMKDAITGDDGTRYKCGRVIVGTRESLYCIERINAKIVVDCGQLIEKGRYRISGLVRPVVRFANRAEFDNGYWRLGRAGERGMCVVVPNQEDTERILSEDIPVYRPPNLSHYLRVLHFNTNVGASVPAALLRMTESELAEMKREAIICGFAQPDCDKPDCDKLSVIGSFVSMNLPCLHPEMASFVMLCAHFGLTFPGIVAASLDATEFRMYQHISLSVDDATRKDCLQKRNVLEFFEYVTSYSSSIYYATNSSTFCVATDAALALLEEYNFTIVPWRSGDEKEKLRIASHGPPITNANNFWSGQFVLTNGPAMMRGVSPFVSMIQRMSRISRTGNYDSDDCVRFKEYLKANYLRDDGFKEFEKVFEMIVNYLQSSLIMNSDTDMIVHDPFNSYTLGSKAGYMLSPEGRVLFRALSAMTSSRFAIRSPGAPGRFVIYERLREDEEHHSEDATYLASSCSTITNHTAVTEEWFRFSSSNAHSSSLPEGKGPRDSSCFITLLDPISSQNMALFSNINSECAVNENCAFDEQQRSFDSVTIQYSASPNRGEETFYFPSEGKFALRVKEIRVYLKRILPLLISQKLDRNKNNSQLANFIIATWQSQ